MRDGKATLDSVAAFRRTTRREEILEAFLIRRDANLPATRHVAGRLGATLGVDIDEEGHAPAHLAILF